MFIDRLKAHRIKDSKLRELIDHHLKTFYFIDEETDI